MVHESVLSTEERHNVFPRGGSSWEEGGKCRTTEWKPYLGDGKQDGEDSKWSGEGGGVRRRGDSGVAGRTVWNIQGGVRYLKERR